MSLVPFSKVAPLSSTSESNVAIVFGPMHGIVKRLCPGKFPLSEERDRISLICLLIVSIEVILEKEDNID